jgi:hypothetical protein
LKKSQSKIRPLGEKIIGNGSSFIDVTANKNLKILLEYSSCTRPGIYTILFTSMDFKKNFKILTWMKLNSTTDGNLMSKNIQGHSSN